MEYTFIPGIRDGSVLLHVVPENRLYVFKIKRNNISEYVCYQSILSANKNRSKIEPKCTARVRIHPNGTLQKMHAPHTLHDDHEAIIRDMEARNNMAKKCNTLKNDFAEDARRIPTRNIFQREIAK